MKELKFCFVMPFHISEGRGGGSEVQAWFLAKELSKRDFCVSYIAQSVKNKEDNTEIIDRVRVRWIRYFYRFRWANALDYYKALKKENPDIVVQRHSSLITGIIGFYTKKYDKKFVWICNENSCSEKWIFLRKQFQLLKENKKCTIKFIYFLAEAFVNDIIRNYGMKHVTHVFSQNNYQRLKLKQSFGLESFRMISVHEKTTKTAPPDKKYKNCIVIWVANFSKNKRPEIFVRLASKFNNSPFHFVMIGTREDELYLKELFSKRPGNFEWKGRLSHGETQEWFDKAAILVNTSLQEGFPSTFVEAWHRGIPVVTMGVDPDGIIQKYGLGYVAKNEDDLAKIIYDFFVMDEKKYLEMSNRIRKYAWHNHSIQRMADNFLNIVLNGKNG